MSALRIILGVLLLARDGFSEAMVAARPTIYPYLLDPSVYPRLHPPPEPRPNLGHL